LTQFYRSMHRHLQDLYHIWGPLKFRNAHPCNLTRRATIRDTTLCDIPHAPSDVQGASRNFRSLPSILSCRIPHRVCRFTPHPRGHRPHQNATLSDMHQGRPRGLFSEEGSRSNAVGARTAEAIVSRARPQVDGLV